MAEEWPKLQRRKTILHKPITLSRIARPLLRVSSMHYVQGLGMSWAGTGMTLMLPAQGPRNISTIMIDDRISAPWERNGRTEQLAYRCKHSVFFTNGFNITLFRNYFSGKVGLAFINSKSRRIIKCMGFADQYFPPKRQRAKQRLLQRIFNRYLKLV